jgi:TorA maturation chaperone TorD
MHGREPTGRMQAAADTPTNDVTAPPRLPDEERLRADLYDFLSGLLAKAPDDAKLEAIARLEPAEGAIGQAVHTLSRMASTFSAHQIDREFHDLFIGLSRGELLPFGSYYLTGFLHEKPLATLRNDMARLGVARADDVHEPEDHIASVLEIMGGLIRGKFEQGSNCIHAQHDFFKAHIDPWAHHFFTDLEGAKNAVFYAAVGTLGRLLVEIEREAFRMEGAAPEGTTPQGDAPSGQPA